MLKGSLSLWVAGWPHLFTPVTECIHGIGFIDPFSGSVNEFR
jgi:hypothetical protein